MSEDGLEKVSLRVPNIRLQERQRSFDDEMNEFLVDAWQKDWDAQKDVLLGNLVSDILATGDQKVIARADEQITVELSEDKWGDSESNPLVAKLRSAREQLRAVLEKTDVRFCKRPNPEP